MDQWVGVGVLKQIFGNLRLLSSIGSIQMVFLNIERNRQERKKILYKQTFIPIERKYVKIRDWLFI